MKLPLLICSILLALSPAFGQAEGEPVPQAGFLQMVNLVSLSKPTFIEIAGLPMSDGEPVDAGESSGVVALIPNEYQFSISNEAAKPKSAGGNVTVENGKNVVIVFFDEEKEFKDGSRETKLRFTILKELAGKPTAKVSLVSLANRLSIPLSANDRKIILTGRQAHPLDVQLGDEIEIIAEGKSLGEIEVEKAIHYIGFVFDDPKSGKLELSVIQEEKLEYQPPIVEEDEEEADAD